MRLCMCAFAVVLTSPDSGVSYTETESLQGKKHISSPLLFPSVILSVSLPPQHSLKHFDCELGGLCQLQWRIIAVCLSFPTVFFLSFPPSFCHSPLVPLSPPTTYCDDCQRQMTRTWHVYMFIYMCVCVCQKWEGLALDLMLLIPPNEHNLEGRLSSYICGLGGVESEGKRREKLCCSFSLCVLSLEQAAVPFLSLCCSTEWKK